MNVFHVQALVPAKYVVGQALSSEYGTRKTVKARFGPWLSGKVDRTFQVALFSLDSGGAYRGRAPGVSEARARR